jgi:hypothetical protein
VVVEEEEIFLRTLAHTHFLTHSPPTN